MSFGARGAFVRMAVAIVLDLLGISRESFRQDPMSPRLLSGTTAHETLLAPLKIWALGEGCRGKNKPGNKWPAVDIRCR